MSAMDHQFTMSKATMLPPGVAGLRVIPGVETLASKWDAVHEAASAVAQLAQLGYEPVDETVRSFPRRAGQGDARRYELAARGIDDLTAVMQPGLRALLTLAARGKDTTAAALTLWREFHRARGAILALADEGANA